MLDKIETGYRRLQMGRIDPIAKKIDERGAVLEFIAMLDCSE